MNDLLMPISFFIPYLLRLYSSLYKTHPSVFTHLHPIYAHHCLIHPEFDFDKNPAARAHMESFLSFDDQSPHANLV